MEPNSLNNTKADPNAKEKPLSAEEARADKPLGWKQHMDGDFHLIGETLADPTVILPVGISSLGTSPFVAREDHSHGIGGSLQFGADDYLNFNDSADQFIFIHDNVTSLIIGKNTTYFPDGTRPAPSIAFINDVNTGFFRAAAGRIGVSSSGVGGLTLGNWPNDPSWTSSVSGPNGYVLLGNNNGAVTDSYFRGAGQTYFGGYGGNALRGDSGSYRFLQNGYSDGFFNATGYVHGNAGLSTNVDLNVARNSITNGQVYANNGSGSGYINMGGWSSHGGYAAINGPYGYILLGAVGLDGSCYVRSTNNYLYLGGTNGVISEQGHTFQANTNTLGSVTSGSQMRSQGPGGVYYNGSNFFADSPGAGVANNGYHPSGVACQFRMGQNIQILYLRGIHGGDNNVDLNLYTLTQVSSGKYKQDIVDWVESPAPEARAMSVMNTVAGEEVEYRPLGPLEALRNVRPVWFRYNKDNHFKQLPNSQRRTEALMRLNTYKESQGQELYDSEELYHLCGRDCGASPEFPCPRMLEWQTGSIGFISEEIGEILPQVTKLDPYTGEHAGVDPLAMAAFGVSVSKAQQDLIDSLLERIERLEALVGSQ